MKKGFALLICICLFLSLLAGCGDKGTSAGVSGSSAGGSATPAGEIVVSMPTYRAGEDPPSIFFKGQVDRFNQKYAGQYKINPDYSGSGEEHNEKIKQLGLQSKLPVVFQFSEFAYAEKNLFKEGVLHDMSTWLNENPEFKNVFLPEGIEHVTQADGKVYALPLAIVRPTGIYYNTQNFTPSKPIRDMKWEELIKEMADQKALYGFQTAEKAWTLNLTTVALIGGMEGGAEYLKTGLQEHITDFNAKYWKDAFTTIKKLYDAAGWTDGMGKTYPELENAFLNNKVAVMPNGQWVVTGLSIDETNWGADYDGTKVSGDIFPNNVAIANPAVYDWYVSGTATEGELALAKAFLEFISSQDELEAMAISEGGSIPMVTPSQKYLDAMKENKLMSEFSAAPNKDTVYVPYLHEVTNDAAMTAFGANLPLFLGGDMSVDEFCQAITDAATE